jgi:hypothetical protein
VVSQRRLAARDARPNAASARTLDDARARTARTADAEAAAAAGRAVRRSYPIVAGLLAMITAIERSRPRPHRERRRYPATMAAGRPARAAAPPATDAGGVP